MKALLFKIRHITGLWCDLYRHLIWQRYVNSGGYLAWLSRRIHAEAPAEFQYTSGWKSNNMPLITAGVKSNIFIFFIDLMK